ncbi:acyl transferase/acyl hydrolase/lysophospholipase [Mycena vulgaris]|nr:acyl transferase/acyl hydrolase/lysophospholipase [Mycena vulgaris]
MSTTVPEEGQNLGVRVLSLDGGGAGALSELLILERMMYRIQQIQGPPATIPSPWQYFELIGGSGTGGIIALMLGRLRMSIPDVISAYKELRPQSKCGSAEQFRASKFEEALKKIFEQEKMRDTSLDPCKTFVCAMNQINMNAGQPQLFRSYDTSEEPVIECMIWEAARATSATPGLFKPMEIGRPGLKQRYIDGEYIAGEEHPETLRTMTSLALTYYDMGRRDKALKPQDRALEARRRVLRSGHPDTEELAATMRQMGEAARVEIQIEHEIMTLRSGGGLGNFDHAEALGMVALTKLRVIDDPEAAEAVATLAETYFHNGKWDEAERMQVVFLVQSGALQHWHALFGMGGLAITYVRKGYLDQAKLLQIASRDGLAGILECNSPRHSEPRDNWRMQTNWALTWLKLERMVASDALGADHPTTLRAQGDLAKTYRQLRRLAEAETLGTEVLENQKTLLGEEHPETLRTMTSLALTYYEMGRCEKALKLQDSVLEARRRILRSYHPDTQEVKEELAATMRQQGEAAGIEIQIEHEIMTLRSRGGVMAN